MKKKICFWSVIETEQDLKNINKCLLNCFNCNFIIFSNLKESIDCKTIKYDNIDKKDNIFMLSFLKLLENENYDIFCYINPNTTFKKDPTDEILNIMEFSPIHIPLDWEIIFDAKETKDIKNTYYKTLSFDYKHKYKLKNTAIYNCNSNFICIDKKFIETFNNQFYVMYNDLIKYKKNINTFDYILNLIMHRYAIDIEMHTVHKCNNLWGMPDEITNDDKCIIYDIFKKRDNIVISPAIICNINLKQKIIEENKDMESNKLTNDFVEESNVQGDISIPLPETLKPHKCCGGKVCKNIKPTDPETLKQFIIPTPTNLKISEPTKSTDTEILKQFIPPILNTLKISEPEPIESYRLTVKRDIVKYIMEGFTSYCVKHNMNPITAIMKYNVKEVVDHILKD